MEYITAKEASEIWKTDISTIGKLLRSDKIKGATKIGGHWVIPRGTNKPTDGRTKKAKENQDMTPFRFPLFVNFPEDSFFPPLSAEETKLRSAQVSFYHCEFRTAKILFEELSLMAENIYVKICASVYMCLLSAVYDGHISYKHYYGKIGQMIIQDFPYKNEIELLLPLLDFYCGMYIILKDKLNDDVLIEYHPSAIYVNAFLSVFKIPYNANNTVEIQFLEPYETLCRLMERDGYYVEAQSLHMLMFILCYSENMKDKKKYHMRKMASIAYEHDLIYLLADISNYYYDDVNEAIQEYSDSFKKRIFDSMKVIEENFARFSADVDIEDVYSKLSGTDYSFVNYAFNGL